MVSLWDQNCLFYFMFTLPSTKGRFSNIESKQNHITLLMWCCLITAHLMMSTRLPQDRKITAYYLVEVKLMVTYSLYILYTHTYIYVSLYILMWTHMLKAEREKSFTGRKAYEEVHHLVWRYKGDRFMLCKNIGSTGTCQESSSVWKHKLQSAGMNML